MLVLRSWRAALCGGSVIGHTTDPAPAPIASKEPEKGKRYFGLYLLVGGLKPYDMESDIETATALAKTMEVSNHIRYGIRYRNDHRIGQDVLHPTTTT